MNGSQKRSRLTLAAVVASVLCLHATDLAVSAEPFALRFPVNCEPGSTCFMQNYVDHGTSGKVSDFRCGGRTYIGHDGTDIRLPDLELQKKGMEVLAAAEGRVTHVRDGMTDVSARIAGKNSIAGKECGNGAVIEHAQGWSTQYCHMAKGSLRVKPGDPVAAGQAIGLIGLSGDTEFPHLHFTVRHNGGLVDPFAYEAQPGACNDGHPIWLPGLLPQIAYREREVLNVGFADMPVTMDAIETGEVKLHGVSPEAGAIVAYSRTIGLQKRDIQKLTIRGPDAQPFAEYQSPPWTATRHNSSFRPVESAGTPDGHQEPTRPPTWSRRTGLRSCGRHLKSASPTRTPSVPYERNGRDHAILAVCELQGLNLDRAAFQ